MNTPMKRPLAILASALLVLALASCGDSSTSGRFGNASLSGPWHLSDYIGSIVTGSRVSAEAVFWSNQDYIVADGRGHITGSSFYGTSTGTYTVDGDGAFTITIGDNTFEGSLHSETSGTITLPGQRALTAITNTAACQNTDWVLSLSEDGGIIVMSDAADAGDGPVTAEFAVYSFYLGVDETGAVTQSGAGPSAFAVTGGHLFCQEDVLVGAVTTADTGAHKKFRLNGFTGGSMPAGGGHYDTDYSHSGTAVGTFLLLYNN